MPRVNEATIQQALADLASGAFSSVNAAAKAYNLTESTLRRRYHGTTTSRARARQTQQLLSPVQESLTRQWILNCEVTGYAISHAQLREFASLLSSSTGGPPSIGVHWVKRFLQRHPDLRSKIGKKIDALRSDGATIERLRPWYDTLFGII
jgi:Tc5 transposase DNA-binding domain/helix-turn-helix, Psq domain